MKSYVIDTNVFILSISPENQYHLILKSISEAFKYFC